MRLTTSFIIIAALTAAGTAPMLGPGLEARAGAPAVGNPTVIGPVPSTATPGDPSHDYPFFAAIADLAEAGYVEEEFFFDGTASRYSIASPLATATVLDGGFPYRTRMVVRRPASAKRFNGTVLMEWQNVTAGYDLDALWLAMSDHLIRRGYAWIGVSAQRVGIHQPGTGLKAWSPVRYGSLDVTVGGTITNDALQFDIFSQAAQAVRNPIGIDPMAGLPVRQVLAAGASQGAGRLVSYHNAIHPLAGVIDGFLLVVGGREVRTDLDTVVFKLLSETDVLGNAVAQSQALIRQPDSDHYRTWEVAGTAHLDYDVRTALEPVRTRDGIAPLPPACDAPQLSSIPLRFVSHAALDHLVEWARFGFEPPTAPGIEIAVLGSPSIAARDSYLNAVGGIRLSQHAVPTATNTGVNLPASTFCRVYGSHEPFDQAVLASLYPRHGTYVSQVTQQTQENLSSGYIVLEDAIATVRAAALSDIR